MRAEDRLRVLAEPRRSGGLRKGSFLQRAFGGHAPPTEARPEPRTKLESNAQRNSFTTLEGAGVVLLDK